MPGARARSPGQPRGYPGGAGQGRAAEPRGRRHPTFGVGRKGWPPGGARSCTLWPGEAELAAAGAAPSLRALSRREVAGSPHRSAPAAALTHRGCWRRARRRGALSAGGGRGRLSRAMPSPHYTPWLVPAERPATSARRGCPCFLRPAGTAAAPPGCTACSAGPGASTAGVPGHGGSAEGEGGRGRRDPPAALPEGRRRWAGGELRQLPGVAAAGESRPAPSAGSGRWHLQPRRSAPGSLSSLLPRPRRTVPRIPGRRQRRGASDSLSGARRGRLLLTLPAASRKLAGRHPRPSAAVPGSAARPSQSVCVSPPLPRSNQKPGGSGVMFAAPS